MPPIHSQSRFVRRARSALTALAFFACSVAHGDTERSGEPAAPWEQHGSLEVSANGHRIQHHDGTPFLWIGDTAWGMFQQLTREEVDKYLDDRQRLGFNVVQAVAFWYPHGGGMKSGPQNASNAYGHRPFSGGEDSPNTSDPLVAEGGSANAPNDYWDHVDYVVNAIKKRGMYLALLPCWGRAYVVPQFGGAHEEFDEKEARTYGAFLGQRYRQEPNIIWVLGGDSKAQIDGYDGGIYRKFDKRAVYRAMAEGIAQGVTRLKPVWNRASPAWKQVFMTYHPDGAFLDNSSSWFHEDAWLTANGVEVWKDIDQVYPTMLRDYQRNPAKPSLFLEGSYEYGTYRHECGWVTPVKVRRQIYHTFFAGGAGHTYGAGPIWSMRGNSGDYNCGYEWKDALDFPAARQFSAVAKAFLSANEWSDWTPDGSAIVSGSGTGEVLKAAVKSTSGRLIVVYFADNSFAQVRNNLAHEAVAQWFDPRNGASLSAGRIAPDEVRGLVPPDRWEDGLLVLRVADSPAWGKNLLREGNDWYGTPTAREVADNVLRYQSPEGGWPKNTNLATWPPSPRDAAFASDGRANTIDNDGTTLPLQYLAKVISATRDDRYRQAFARGLEYVLAAQYSNGGWPQFFPLREGYYSHITFNDDAMTHVLSLLRDVARGDGAYAFTDSQQRARAAEAVKRGIDLILRTQIRQGTRLTAWCAQYDEKTLEPAWARAYEPPSLSGNESVGILRFLMEIESPSPEVSAAIDGGVHWLESAAIRGLRVETFTDKQGDRDRRVVSDATASRLWARFYELGTNRPIFLGRDSVVRYSFDQIEKERRAGYWYYGEWAEELLSREYPAWAARVPRRDPTLH